MSLYSTAAAVLDHQIIAYRKFEARSTQQRGSRTPGADAVGRIRAGEAAQVEIVARAGEEDIRSEVNSAVHSSGSGTVDRLTRANKSCLTS